MYNISNHSSQFYCLNLRRGSMSLTIDSDGMHKPNLNPNFQGTFLTLTIVAEVCFVECEQIPSTTKRGIGNL